MIKRYSLGFALLAAVLVAYGSLAGADLLWDAKLQVIPMPFTWAEIKQIWTTNYWYSAIGDAADSSEYRPLGSMILRILAGLGNPQWTMHVIAIALHLLNVWFMHRAMLRLHVAPKAAVLALFLFAVHPVNTEAIASVVGICDLLVTTGLLSLVLLILRSVSWTWLSVLCFALPLIKESGISAAGLGLIAAAAFLVQRDTRRAKRVALSCLAGALAYLVLRHWLFPLQLSQAINDRQIMLNPILNTTGIWRWLSPMAVVGTYGRALLAADNIRVIYGYGSVPLIQSWQTPLLWLPLVGLAVVGYVSWKRWCSGDKLFTALILAMAVTYAPVSHYIASMGTNVGLRLIYPVTPFFACAVATICARLPKHLFAMAGFLGVGLLLLRTTFWVVPQWRTEQSFLEAVKAQSKTNLFAAILSAEGAYNQSNWHLAHSYCDQALAIYPDFIPAIVLRAKLQAMLVGPQSAMDGLRQVMSRRSHPELQQTMLLVSFLGDSTPAGQCFPEPWDPSYARQSMQSMEHLIQGGTHVSSKLGPETVAILITYLVAHEQTHLFPSHPWPVDPQFQSILAPEWAYLDGLLNPGMLNRATHEGETHGN
ncbi:MAG: hypothetical protein KDC35_05090 [Acidobacteria bacterium]|nr:hypothetical protein [Acidobacteriota bacterium]